MVISFNAVARVNYFRDEMRPVDARLIRPCGVAIGLWCKAFADNKGMLCLASAVRCVLCGQLFAHTDNLIADVVVVPRIMMKFPSELKFERTCGFALSILRILQALSPVSGPRVAYANAIPCKQCLKRLASCDALY